MIDAQKHPDHINSLLHPAWRFFKLISRTRTIVPLRRTHPFSQESTASPRRTCRLQLERTLSMRTSETARACFSLPGSGHPPQEGSQTQWFVFFVIYSILSALDCQCTRFSFHCLMSGGASEPEAVFSIHPKLSSTSLISRLVGRSYGYVSTVQQYVLQ